MRPEGPSAPLEEAWGISSVTVDPDALKAIAGQLLEVKPLA